MDCEPSAILILVRYLDREGKKKNKKQDMGECQYRKNNIQIHAEMRYIPVYRLGYSDLGRAVALLRTGLDAVAMARSEDILILRLAIRTRLETP